MQDKSEEYTEKVVEIMQGCCLSDCSEEDVVQVDRKKELTDQATSNQIQVTVSPSTTSFTSQNDVSAAIQPRKLFIGQLPTSYTQRDLYNLFSSMGEVVDCSILSSQGLSRGCGFVKFKEEASAVSAMQALHQKLFLRDNAHPVNIRWAETHSERAARKALTNARTKSKVLLSSDRSTAALTIGGPSMNHSALANIPVLKSWKP